MRLLAPVRAQTTLLRPTPGQGSVGWAAPIFLINRLKNLAMREGVWLRSPETWRANGATLRREFRSLATHLLCDYPTPGFMDQVWDLPDGPAAFRQQSWYIRLGRGTKLRSLNLPITLTRQMEHYARRAPDHYTVLQALRYGETKGLGGTEILAREIAMSRLGQEDNNGDFWRTAVRFLVTHTSISLKHISAIVEFVHTIKFAGEQVLTVDGPKTMAAPCPGFSLEGRTPKSLLQLMRNSGMQTEQAGANLLSWNPSGLKPYSYLEHREGEASLHWTIVELVNSSALHAEGRALCHCVGTYVTKCHRGAATIWSLRLRVRAEEKRMATIEVNPKQREIVQVRAKRNRPPGVRSEQIIRQWATHAGLQYDTATAN